MELLEQLKSSIQKDNFVRLTLSKARSQDLKKLRCKLTFIKNELHLSFVYQYLTKDITKNYRVKEGLQELEKLLNNEFEIANLFTTQADFIWEKANSRLRKVKPTFQKTPPRQHDKDKNRAIDKPNYLVELGILDQKGRIKKDKGDKYKQINKFVEILDGLLKPLLSKPQLKIVDMGSGKGYLTFALYDYIANTLQQSVSIVGIEMRQNLVDICNRIAKNANFEGLSFQQGTIEATKLEKIEVLIALHACDTATDDAIAKGIQAQADLIICAPCCHKQIRRQMQCTSTFEPLLQYGILEERQAEIVTDGIRALLLEAEGYQTKVFEFISTEHTGKNVMIVGQKQERKVDRAAIFEKINKIKKEMGVEYHQLERLLVK